VLSFFARRLKFIGYIFVTVLLAGCNIEANRLALTPIPTPDLPRVEFLYPENNSIVIEGVDLTLDIVAYDETSGVTQIEVFIDGVSLQQVVPPDSLAQTTFRIETNWLSAGIGRHSISAIASRGDGVRSDEAILIVEVQPPQ